MPREKFKTLTEQMFYILLCLQRECQGVDVLELARNMTQGRVNIGSGTLYDLLEQFDAQGFIRQTRAQGRRRSYIITEKGREMLEKEYRRLLAQAADYERVLGRGMTHEREKTPAGAHILLRPHRHGGPLCRDGTKGLAH